MSDKTLPFVEKVLDYATTNPKFEVLKWVERPRRWGFWTKSGKWLRVEAKLMEQCDIR
jgi:hypothetical protein